MKKCTKYIFSKKIECVRIFRTAFWPLPDVDTNFVRYCWPYSIFLRTIWCRFAFWSDIFHARIPEIRNAKVGILAEKPTFQCGRTRGPQKLGPVPLYSGDPEKPTVQFSAKSVRWNFSAWPPHSPVPKIVRLKNSQQFLLHFRPNKTRN